MILNHGELEKYPAIKGLASILYAQNHLDSLSIREEPDRLRGTNYIIELVGEKLRLGSLLLTKNGRTDATDIQIFAFGSRCKALITIYEPYPPHQA
ncbi:hypothetical protein ACS5NO_20640 [Larkinella sp. GY13]|uniref:hypothetical protein n=1 Tax=Larkinella sp. GY13 TaxID=3453720 RepID=UPI003EE97FFC